MVVVIIGLLAVVAVPALGRYLRRARTSEALQSVERISAGARAYYEATHSDVNARPLARQFPATVAVTPTGACCDGPADRCTSTTIDWSTNTWRALKFDMTQGHSYQYQFTSAGVDGAATFTIDAVGNLDCDAVTATYRSTGSVDANSLRPIATRPFVVGGPANEIE